MGCGCSMVERVRTLQDCLRLQRVSLHRVRPALCDGAKVPILRWVCACVFLHLAVSPVAQERLSTNYAELSGAFKTSLEGLARTVQDLHSIIK